MHFTIVWFVCFSSGSSGYSHQITSNQFFLQKHIFGIKGTVEEITLSALSSFDNLSKQLKELDEIPLTVTSVQGTSSILRYSDPFPLLPNASTTIKKSISCRNNFSIFDENQILKHMPLYVPLIEGICSLF